MKFEGKFEILANVHRLKIWSKCADALQIRETELAVNKSLLGLTSFSSIEEPDESLCLNSTL